MEEEDGRPGARATQTGVPSDRSSSLGWSQTGPPDAPYGVPTPSLQIPTCHSERSEEPAFQLRTVAPHLAFEMWVRFPNLRTPISLFQIEENNENVPGK